MIARRFEQLEAAILSRLTPPGFKLTTRGKRVVRIFSLLQAVLGRPNRWRRRMTREGLTMFLKIVYRSVQQGADDAVEVSFMVPA